MAHGVLQTKRSLTAGQDSTSRSLHLGKTLTKTHELKHTGKTNAVEAIGGIGERSTADICKHTTPFFRKTREISCMSNLSFPNWDNYTLSYMDNSAGLHAQMWYSRANFGGTRTHWRRISPQSRRL